MEIFSRFGTLFKILVIYSNLYPRKVWVRKMKLSTDILDLVHLNNTKMSAKLQLIWQPFDISPNDNCIFFDFWTRISEAKSLKSNHFFVLEIQTF